MITVTDGDTKTVQVEGWQEAIIRYVVAVKDKIPAHKFRLTFHCAGTSVRVERSEYDEIDSALLPLA